nr:LacI family DNA-binding transcriptional regulator [uncultured Mediterraneibacter sp.]
MASIGDVAKLAGVSRSTVSLVCNNKGYVSEETRKKIERAMKELNYIPSELGRNLKMQRSGIVGIIVPDIAHPFFSTFIKYAERELYSRGYKALVCGTAGREDVEEAYLQMLDRRTMDGVIMGAHSLKKERYLKINRPIVTLDRYLADYIPTVHVDKRQVAEKAAGLFLERNRKKVVQLVSSHTIKNYEDEKEQVFRETLQNNGCEVVDISVGYNTFTAERYRDAVVRVFEECSDMDGILGVDMAAIACLREAQLRGRKVPEDLSIVSIDGTYITRMGPEILTSLVQPVEGMAKKLVSMIILQIEGKQIEEVEAIFDVSIQSGETC